MRTYEFLLRFSITLGLAAAACSTSEAVPQGASGGRGGATTGPTGSGGGSGGAPDPGCVGGATTGSAGDGGGAGDAGNGGGGRGGAASNVPDAGSSAPVPSQGCGKMATETPAQFVKHSLMSSGQSRDFFTYLPAQYNPERPYRTIFTF